MLDIATYIMRKIIKFFRMSGG